ncbi:hypothetical protein BS50DRAFT_399047 [Corynespora cassiicola Philippines]|uniref:Uncharacterized protein n=1 Tax=Corynespora cassiicola Philippines TaxID=1448308 RepID=A0A2T2NKQ0_CORCC|nr:hypothetical protein BS50DRAFT_399047 [Corynespora cassiicola Philippines]
MQNYVQADRFRYDRSLVSKIYGEHSPPLFNLVPRSWNPESKREEENSVPIRYIETVLPQDTEEHTAPHVDTKVSPVTKTAKTSVPTKSTPGLIRKVQPLPISSDANERQPLVFRKYTWRDSIDTEATAAYFQKRKQQRSTLEKLGKSTGSIQLAVHNLTTNARQMMADIHQRTRNAKRHHFVYVSMANFLQDVQAENKRYRFLYFLDKLSSDAALLDAHFFILEREAQYLFSSRARSLISKLEDFTTRMGDRIELYDHIFTKTVSKIVLYTQVRTKLFDLANNSAIDVYNLNIALRRHLAAMLTARQRHKLPHPMARGIPPLETRLVALRVFAKNLFVNSDAVYTPAEIRHHLNDIEVQKHPGTDPRVRIRKFSAKPLPEDREVWRPFLEHRLRVVGTRMEHEEKGLERRGFEEEGQGGDDEVSREDLMEMWREQVKSLKKRDVLRQVSGWIGGVQTGKFNNNLLGADFKGRKFGEDSSTSEDTEGRKGIDV